MRDTKMQTTRRAVRIVIGLITFAAALVAASAGAQDAGAMREAGRHFQRAVVLYGEADYRAALVEFKRAYATSPNVAVLYNVGETEYQLQDYAGALTTFERYLSEAGTSEPHRGEVESTLDVLRARVGHVVIATSPPGAEITLDDQSIGRTPFDRGVLVSIGRRKVVASMTGRPAVTRYVDVVADDNVPVSIILGGAAGEPSVAGAAAPTTTARGESSATTTSGSSNAGPTLRTVGWLVTGVSVAGAVSFGLLALKESSDLSAARAAYPTTSATLNHDAALTTTYSIVADSLTAAAVVVGGITLYSTLASSASSSSSKRGSAAGTTRLSLGPTSARFEMTF